MALTAVPRQMIRLLLLTSTLWLSTSQLGAQAISGRVVTQSGLPIAGANVADARSGRSVRADSVGAFTLRLLGAETVVLVVAAVGYRPDTVHLSGLHLSTPLTITLSALPVLRPVTVTAMRSQLPRVAERESRGLGAVLYAEEIEALGRYTSTDVVMFSPRLSIIAGARPLLFVDGIMFPDRPWRWDDDAGIRLRMPRPSDIAAVEVQRGFAGMRETDIWFPPSLNYSTSRRIIFIWTKDYVRKQNAGASGPDSIPPPPAPDSLSDHRLFRM